MTKTAFTQTVLNLSHQAGCSCTNCATKKALNGLPVEPVHAVYEKALHDAVNFGGVVDERAFAAFVRNSFVPPANRPADPSAQTALTPENIHRLHDGLGKEELAEHEARYKRGGNSKADTWFDRARGVGIKVKKALTA